MLSRAYPALRARRQDAILLALRQGERTIHDLAGAINMHPEHTRVYYVNGLIAEGKAHIARAERGPKHSLPNAYPIYAYGAPPEGMEHCHKAQLAKARAALGLTFREGSLTPVLEALRYDDLTLMEVCEAISLNRCDTKRRLDFLIDRGDAHVLCRERRPGVYHGLYVYAFGPGKGLPDGAKKQYARASRRHLQEQAAEKERRKELLSQPARVDIAASWIPHQTATTEIRQ